MPGAVVAGGVVGAGAGEALRQLIGSKLGFEQEEVRIILVNGHKASLDDIIKEEMSIISLFPAVGGG